MRWTWVRMRGFWPVWTSFDRYGGSMRQSLVAPPLFALVAMLMRGAPRISPAHVQAWRGF